MNGLKKQGTVWIKKRSCLKKVGTEFRECRMVWRKVGTVCRRWKRFGDRRKSLKKVGSNTLEEVGTVLRR